MDACAGASAGRGAGPDDVLVVVPAYHEESAVGAVVAELRARFDHVLVVDDGSTDGTASAAQAAGATVLRHPVNLGQGAALQTGFDHALRLPQVQWVVTFDADGQHLVEDAVAMVHAGRSHDVDVVLASRFAGATVDMPFLRGMILRTAVRFTRATAHLDVTDTHNGLRVLRRTALQRMRLHQPRMAYASELLAAITTHGLSYCEVPTSVRYSEYSRAKGQRNINAVNILFDLAVARLRAAA